MRTPAEAAQLAVIASTARRLMDKHGLHDWSFGFDRAVRRIGGCWWQRRRITLSEALVLQTNADVIVNTILHEIAHALVGAEHVHDEVWKKQALAIGCDGERCYDGTQVTPILGQWRAVCPGCSTVFHKHRQPKRQRHCRKCGSVHGRLVFRRPE